MERIDRILVATDLSETSRAAFAPAGALARRFGAELLVLYVEDERWPPLVVEYMAVGLEEIRRRQHEHAREQLVRFVEGRFGAGVALTLDVVSGVPHAEIVRQAEAHGVDLIVIATHGRGFISHAIMGSTTERVLRAAPCPVLVVRGGEAS